MLQTSDPLKDTKGPHYGRVGSPSVKDTEPHISQAVGLSYEGWAALAVSDVAQGHMAWSIR